MPADSRCSPNRPRRVPARPRSRPARRAGAGCPRRHRRADRQRPRDAAAGPRLYRRAPGRRPARRRCPGSDHARRRPAGRALVGAPAQGSRARRRGDARAAAAAAALARPRAPRGREQRRPPSPAPAQEEAVGGRGARTRPHQPTARNHDRAGGLMAKKNGGSRPKISILPGNSPSASLPDFLTEPGASAKPPSSGRTQPGGLPENKRPPSHPPAGAPSPAGCLRTRSDLRPRNTGPP
jgi:hypothetical protein